jgi:hypothetical protein
VRRYTSDGFLVWTYFHEPALGDTSVTNAVAVDPNDDVIAAGWEHSDAHPSDIWVAKLPP